MTIELINAAVAGVVIASLGLWWFRIVMKNIRQVEKTKRYGIYAVIWLAYFMTTMLVIANSGAGG